MYSLADEVRVGSALADFHGLAPEAGTGSSRRTALPWPARPPAASIFLQPNRAGGVLTEQRALPDVSAQHRRALVARLLGDDALGDTAAAAEVARPARNE